jgi:Cu/Ag efflux pump CusA
MKDIQSAIASHVSLPQGYHIEYGGAFAEQQKSFQRIVDDPFGIKPSWSLLLS